MRYRNAITATTTAVIGATVFLIGTILHPARDGHGVAAAGPHLRRHPRRSGHRPCPAGDRAGKPNSSGRPPAGRPQRGAGQGRRMVRPDRLRRRGQPRHRSQRAPTRPHRCRAAEWFAQGAAVPKVGRRLRVSLGRRPPWTAPTPTRSASTTTSFQRMYTAAGGTTCYWDWTNV
jgi:hypothetical protein